MGAFLTQIVLFHLNPLQKRHLLNPLFPSSLEHHHSDCDDVLEGAILLAPRHSPCALSSLTSFSQRRLFHSQNKWSFWASLALRPRLRARRTKVRLHSYSPGAVQIHSKISTYLKKSSVFSSGVNQSKPSMNAIKPVL